MKKFVTAFTIISFFLLTVLAQKKASEPFKKWHQQALALYKLDEPTATTDSTALRLFLKSAQTAARGDEAIAIDCFIKAGNIHQGYQRFAEANSLYYAALNLNKKYSKKAALTYEAYLYLGSSHYFNNIIDSAQFYFEAASDIAMSYTGMVKLPELDVLYNSLGAIYLETANYNQAKNYFEKALDFSSPAADDYKDLYNAIRSNIASCLIKLNQYDSALRILKALQPDEQQKEIIRQNTANSYFQLGLYDSALSIYENLSLKSGYASVVALTNMGRIYMYRKQWQQAEIVFDSAISRNKLMSASLKNKEEALAYLYRSRLAQAQGFTDEAITWVNEALQEVHMEFKLKKNEDLPVDVAKTVSPITMFAVLHEKAGLLYKKYKQVRQKNWLAASLATYSKAIETANYIKTNFDNDEAKLFFNENYKTIYNDAVQVAYEAVSSDKKAADDFIFILENYKGNVLFQNVQNVILKSTANVPDSIRTREKEIKQLLAFYTSRLNQTTGEKDAGKLQNRLLTLQVELSRLQKKYAEDANYNLYKNQQSSIKLSLAFIQQALPENTSLLNYYLSADSVIFCLVVTKNNFLVEKIETDNAFVKTFKQYITGVYKHEEGERYEGYEAAVQLYKKLILPVEAAIKNTDNLVIIPDGKLYYLPFEALMKDKAKKDFLLLSKVISYHYSFALLFSNNSYKKKIDSKAIVGFAPFTLLDSNIVETDMPILPLSDDEVKETTAKIITGVNATKESFIKETVNYPIIHLATHASTGTDTASNWIQFYPIDSFHLNDKLFLPEVYNLDLHQAELVVLSACETGGGVEVSGEGLLSLSRAFMYAGADGVVSTLWKTEDKVTSYLMKKMYVYLNNNYPAQKALQKAKIDLLADETIASKYKAPNYWANFTYTGKLAQAPAKRPITNYLWLFAVTAFVFAGGLWVWQKRKKPHAEL